MKNLWLKGVKDHIWVSWTASKSKCGKIKQGEKLQNSKFPSWNVKLVQFSTDFSISFLSYKHYLFFLLPRSQQPLWKVNHTWSQRKILVRIFTNLLCFLIKVPWWVNYSSNTTHMTWILYMSWGGDIQVKKHEILCVWGKLPDNWLEGIQKTQPRIY